MIEKLFKSSATVCADTLLNVFLAIAVDNLANAQELTAQEEEAMAREEEARRLAEQQAELLAKAAQEAEAKESCSSDNTQKRKPPNPNVSLLDSLVYDGSDPTDLVYAGDDKTLNNLQVINEEPEKTVIVFKDAKNHTTAHNDLRRVKKKDDVPPSVRRQRLIPYSSMFCLSPANP